MAKPVERGYCPAPEIRVAKSDEGSTVEWYAAVFDSLSEDLWGFREKVHRRAFTKTLQEADVRALLNHNPDPVLGRNKAGTLKLRVDHTGLRATATLPDTQWARDLLVSVERGDITGGSFGFRVLDDKWTPDDEYGYIRELREVQLFDVSLVTYPAYPGTDGSAAVRSALAGLCDPDDLLHPLLRLRAGVPLGDEDRGRFEAVLNSLRSALPAPLEPELPADGHAVAAAIRRRKLELLKLKEGW